MDFFKKIGRREIEKEVAFLKANLPRKATKRNYQLTHKILGARNWGNVNLQTKLQEVSNLMCEYLLIDDRIKILTLKNVDAGKFEMIDGMSCIFINDDLENQNFDQKVAILAHELSHYFLMRKHNIIRSNVDQNELLTEVNAVYVGFGFLLLKGYEKNKVVTSIGMQTMKSISKVGYISTQNVFDAIIETAYVRKQKPQWISRKIGFAWYFESRDRLKQLRAEYKRAKKRKKK